MLTAFSRLFDWPGTCSSGAGLVLRSRESLEAEILFLRRQLAMYRERGVKPKRIDAATRVALTFLSRWFDWRSALVVVRPETLIRWHRAGELGHEILDGERQLQESIAQREREQKRHPRGSPNGDKQDREDDRRWRNHQTRIDEETEKIAQRSLAASMKSKESRYD